MKRILLLAGLSLFPTSAWAAQIGSSLSKPEDGTSLINRSDLDQLAGIPKDMQRSAFDAAVVQERANITNNGVGVWNNGEKISIFGEVGTRIWFVGASAAASHARNVLYQGQTYALGADSNVFGPTAGAPAAGTGNVGDYMADATSGLVYGPKSSGGWPAGMSATLTAASLAAFAGTLPTTSPGIIGAVYLNNGAITVVTSLHTYLATPSGLIIATPNGTEIITQ